MSSTTLTVVPGTKPRHTSLDDALAAARNTEPSASDDTAVEVEVPPEATAKYMDPAELVIAENVRKDFDVAAHPKQAASIRDLGIRGPVLAEREPDGSVHVYDGQVRVLIAQAVGRTRIPVWITDAPIGVDAKQRRIDRTIAQINLNERRIPLSQSDYAAGVALMMDLGASATRVANGLQHEKRAEVRKLAAIGRSATGRRLADDGQYSLDQLAVIAEYENRGDTDAVEQLLSTYRYNFAHTANKIATDREQTRRRLRASVPYGALGFGILTDEPGDGYLPVTELATSDGSPVSEEHILADPARWIVWVDVEPNGELVDTATGAIVDPDTVDWDTRTDPDTPPREGLRRADGLDWRDRWIPSYYLPADQLDTAGLRLLVDTAVTDAEQAAAQQAAVDREQARLDRRRTRFLNLRGLEAAEHRQKFLTGYVQGNTAPRQTIRFVAEYLARNLDPSALHTATTLLGIKGSTPALVAAIESASVNRTSMIMLAMVLAAHEAPLDKSLWRTRSQATTRYLHLLAEIANPDDYTPSAVEQAAAGDIDYHDIPLD
ncbi:ParB/Srx family N-terminal domain-containing protein [Nocardia nova]|uniref:ParB/Srx family N-terminal domain-containing protein n=1 Tax=Nocardia nova TaxID=37330 RepID=UPI0033EC6E9D